METRSIFDFEFTLALNNRTGKYFYCCELIDSSADLIRSCVYWRWRAEQLPPDLPRRILGRAARWEVELRSRYHALDRARVSWRPRRPIAFSDPREVVLHRPRPFDVVICHDMGPVTHGHLYSPGVSRIYEQAFAAIRAARPFMVFVSEDARSEFAAIYSDDYPLMQVVSFPIRSGMASDGLRRPAGVPDRFFLTVGAVGERKNQLRAVRAFHHSRLAESGYAYVICGGMTEAGAEQVKEAAGETPGVILAGYTADDELRWLYQNASGFVLPSLLEGFGLPAAEAIHHGLVPLLSTGGALQEVAGDAAIYVDPMDLDDIAGGLRQLAEMDDEERERRVHELRQHLGRFSPEKELDKWRQTLLLAADAWAGRTATG